MSELDKTVDFTRLARKHLRPSFDEEIIQNQ